jgi:hypothetical protein
MRYPYIFLLHHHFAGELKQLGPAVAFDEIHGRRDNFLGVSLSGTNYGNGDRTTLPKIMVVDLSYRHIEAVSNALLKTLYHLPLVLERLAIGQMELHFANYNNHAALTPG